MQYSPFLAAAVLRNIVVPLVVTWLATQLLHISLAWRIRLPVYIAALIVSFWLLSYVSLFRQNWVARRLHPQAVPIPRVKGRWPLNLDVMVDWMQSSKSEYLGEGMIATLEKKYGKTMNTRVLGEDSVCTLPFPHRALYQYMEMQYGRLSPLLPFTCPTSSVRPLHLSTKDPSGKSGSTR